MADWKTPWQTTYKKKEGIDWVDDDSFDVDAWNVKHGAIGEDAEQSGLNFDAYKKGLGQQKLFDQNKQSLANEQRNRQQSLTSENTLSQKYLNQSLKNRGLAGNGIGGTTAELSLRNNMMNNMGAVNANIGSRESALNMQKNEFDNNLYDTYYGTGGQRHQLRDKYLKIQQDTNNTIKNALSGAATSKDIGSIYDYYSKSGEINDKNKVEVDAFINYVKSQESFANNEKAYQLEQQSLADAYAKAEEDKKFNQLKSSNATFNNNGGWWIFGKTDFSNGDNFSVKSGSDILRIESSGEVTDSNITSKANEIANGNVFGVGGKIYIKKNGKIYGINGRGGNANAGHYNKLYKSIYG